MVRIIGLLDIATRQINRKTGLALKVEQLANDCHAEDGRFCGGGVSSSKSSTKAGKQAHVSGKQVRMGPDLISDGAVKNTIERQSNVPGFEDFQGRTDRKALDEIIDRQADNIVESADRSFDVSKSAVDLHSQWYPVANKWTADLAEANGLHHDAVTAATAALSPSADWADNVAWAKNITETVSKQESITISKEAAEAWYLTRLAAYEGKKAAATEAGKTFKPKGGIPKFPDHIVGKKLSELSDLDAAVAIRGMHDEAAGGEGAVRQLGGHAGFGNPKLLTRPQSDENMAKAISILRNPTTSNIDAQLGQAHKVRSFYNNIRNPRDSEFTDVTVDTHHYGVANGFPWASSSKYIASGTASITAGPTSGQTGVSGTYPLIVEATRRAASRINQARGTNYTPNQIQSIVWEEHRVNYPPKIRSNKTLQDSIALARTARAKGEISKAEEDARIDAARLKAGGTTNDEKTRLYQADLAGAARPTLTELRR